MHTSLFATIWSRCVLHTRCVRDLHRTFKSVLMKKVVLSFFAAAVAFVSFGQDASQPQGSWYLGSGDATTLLNIFSTGVDMHATVGYAVVDDIVATLSFNNSSDSTGMELDGTTFEDMSFNLGVQYFIDDYYVGLGLGDPLNDLELGLNAGRYIPFKDVLYIAPQLGLKDLTGDPHIGLNIGVGARF